MERTTGSTSCTPRFATPRDERFPTLGPEIGLIARRLGRELMPWQQEAADVAGEYDPDTGSLRYDETDITVPRQSGKTTLVLAKKVHRLTVLARRYGPQRSTYIAQTRLKARGKLERDFAEMLRASRSFREVANAKARPQKGTEWRLSLNNGAEHIQFGRGNFLQIDAPSRTGGHGDTLDDGTIDEAFAQEDDTVEGGMRPSMATRRNAQLWVISTAGDARSKYLWRKVLAGRAACESGNHGSICYVEFSAPDEADPADPATWHGCMPALGLTISEQFIRSEWERAQRKGSEGINTFRRAYLNQWPDVPLLDELEAVAFTDAWDSCADPTSEVAGVPMLAVTMTPDNRTVSLLAAGRRRDGLVHVEVVAHGPVDGLYEGRSFVARVADVAARHGAEVVLHPGHAVASLLPDLMATSVRLRTIDTAEYVATCGTVYRLVMDGRLRYRPPQPELAEAVSRASRKFTGQTWRWAGEQISPLVGATQAVWAVNNSSQGGWAVSL